MVKIVIDHKELLRHIKQTILRETFKNDLLFFIFYRSANLFEYLNCFKALSLKTILLITIILTPKRNHVSVHIVLQNFGIKKRKNFKTS